MSVIDLESNICILSCLISQRYRQIYCNIEEPLCFSISSWRILNASPLTNYTVILMDSLVLNCFIEMWLPLTVWFVFLAEIFQKPVKLGKTFCLIIPLICWPSSFPTMLTFTWEPKLRWETLWPECFHTGNHICLYPGTKTAQIRDYLWSLLIITGLQCIIQIFIFNGVCASLL